MKNQQSQHQAMQISKAQIQQPNKQQSQHKDKSKTIFGLIMLAAIAIATYIAVNSDNPYIWFGLIAVSAFAINNSQDFKNYRDVVDSATPYILQSDKAGRVPSIFIGDNAADVFEID